jgi:hypothetical protein
MAIELLLLTLTIQATIGDITLVGWNGPGVEIDGDADVVRTDDSVTVTLRGDAVTVRVPHTQRLRARLDTVIGNIQVRRAALTSGDIIRLRSFNGDVTLGLAAPPTDARILALSLGGAIHSDLPLTQRTSAGPRFAETTLGDAGALVSIDVVRGDIRITTEAP